MFNRSFRDTVRGMQTAMRFANLMRSRAGLADEGAARPTALDAMMRQAHAEATIAFAARGSHAATAKAATRTA